MGAPGINNTDLLLKRFRYKAAAKCAIHVWQKGLPAGDMLGSVCYMDVQGVGCTHPGQTWSVMCQGFLLTKLLQG